MEKSKKKIRFKDDSFQQKKKQYCIVWVLKIIKAFIISIYFKFGNLTSGKFELEVLKGIKNIVAERFVTQLTTFMNETALFGPLKRLLKHLAVLAPKLHLYKLILGGKLFWALLKLQ